MSSIIVFKFCVIQPLNACTQVHLISSPCPWYVTDGKNIFYCKWQSIQLKVPWAKEKSTGISSFRHGLNHGTQRVSSEPHLSHLFLSGWLPSQACRPLLVARWLTDSGSSHLDALFQVTAAKVPKYDTNTLIYLPLNQYLWSRGRVILIDPLIDLGIDWVHFSWFIWK